MNTWKLQLEVGHGAEYLDTKNLQHSGKSSRRANAGTRFKEMVRGSFLGENE